MNILMSNILVLVTMSFATADYESLVQSLKVYKDNFEGLSTAVMDLHKEIDSNKLNTEQLAVLQGRMVEALKSLKNFDVAVDKTLKEFDSKIKELQNSQKNLSKENLDRLEELVERVKNLEKSKSDLDRLGSNLNNALNSKNADDIKKLQKQIDEMMQNNVAKNFADNVQAADQILKQIQAFTSIRKVDIVNLEGGKRTRYIVQVLSEKNGKKIPLSGIKLFVGTQIQDGLFKEITTIETDDDGIAIFESEPGQRNSLRKINGQFVMKYSGDLLTRPAEFKVK